MFVKQAIYDAVVSERDKALEKSSLLQSQFEANEIEVKQAKADLLESIKQVEELQGSINAKNNEIENLKVEKDKLSGLPGAITAVVVSAKEAIEVDAKDEQEILAGMTISERIFHLKKSM
ncbi:MAG: hypothetical protein WCK02_16100 [Bacteroidota bacterium]